MMRIEHFGDNKIRFIEYQGEWWAILKDVCDPLGLRTDKVSSRLDSDMVAKAYIPVANCDMLIVNESGIYETLYSSRKLEARKFRRWSGTVMRKLRASVGLKQYEVFRMTEPAIQEDIDNILDTLYYDEETNTLMQSITVQGGDVEQVPFE